MRDWDYDCKCRNSRDEEEEQLPYLFPNTESIEELEEAQCEWEISLDR